MNKAHDVLEAALPLKPPVPDDSYPELVETMVGMLADANPVLRILRDSFDPVGVIKFISMFNGMEVTIQSRAYWTTVFRDAHIHMVLRLTPKKEDEAAWRKAVLALARKYNLPPKVVVKISTKVRAAINKRSVYEETQIDAS